MNKIQSCKSLTTVNKLACVSDVHLVPNVVFIYLHSSISILLAFLGGTLLVIKKTIAWKPCLYPVFLVGPVLYVDTMECLYEV